MAHEARQSNSEFDAAKTIADLLKGFDRAQQERILRWVAESLGVQGAAQASQIIPSPSLPPDSGGTSDVGGLSAVPGAGSDIRTFVRSRSPKSDNQLAAAVAYYYKFVAPPAERRDAIDGATLADAIRLISGWKQPKRPQMTLFNAKNQGYLDAAGDGKFKINSVGENLVTMTLGGGGEAAVDQRKPRRRGSTAKRKARAKPRK